ncbi:hypothetical protein CBR_g57900 [Chara braunii]|uniref:Myb-like domain-containing protein n=1 Tax=Chara braunii TaxID=69332 RepID=A0A388MEG2_CHABU|nr:hypothetical protein CBR_g57900 [Chara braunii]|eukprot:GBG92944.1 hypothetical protein CBR_g57900 [Chara braunii]
MQLNGTLAITINADSIARIAMQRTPSITRTLARGVHRLQPTRFGGRALTMIGAGLAARHWIVGSAEYVRESASLRAHLGGGKYCSRVSCEPCGEAIGLDGRSVVVRHLPVTPSSLLSSSSLPSHSASTPVDTYTSWGACGRVGSRSTSAAARGKGGDAGHWRPMWGGLFISAPLGQGGMTSLVHRLQFPLGIVDNPTVAFGCRGHRRSLLRCLAATHGGVVGSHLPEVCSKWRNCGDVPAAAVLQHPSPSASVTGVGEGTWSTAHRRGRPPDAASTSTPVGGCADGSTVMHNTNAGGGGSRAGVQAPPAQKQVQWFVEECLALDRIQREDDALMADASSVHKHMKHGERREWIARRMRDEGWNRSTKDCRKKWFALGQKLKLLADKVGQSGKSGYFDIMMTVEEREAEGLYANFDRRLWAKMDGILQKA